MGIFFYNMTIFSISISVDHKSVKHELRPMFGQRIQNFLIPSKPGKGFLALGMPKFLYFLVSNEEMES